MTRRPVIALVVVAVLAAAYFGYRAGRIPTDAEILTTYAARYISLAGEDARPEDCEGRPHEAEAIRMVIVCAAPEGSQAIFFVGPRGGPVAPPEGPDA